MKAAQLLALSILLVGCGATVSESSFARPNHAGK